MPSNPRWNTKDMVSEMKAGQSAEMGQKPDYKAWSQESLIERVMQLEKELKDTNKRFALLIDILVNTLLICRTA